MAKSTGSCPGCPAPLRADERERTSGTSTSRGPSGCRWRREAGGLVTSSPTSTTSAAFSLASRPSRAARRCRSSRPSLRRSTHAASPMSSLNRQRDALRHDRPDDAVPLPAEPRRARDPPHPEPGRHALDQWQDRGLLGDRPGRGSRPARTSRISLRSAPTPPTTTTTGSTASSAGGACGTVRRDALHQPGIRAPPVAHGNGRSPRRLARRVSLICPREDHLVSRSADV